MEFKVYPLLSTRSKRAMIKQRKRGKTLSRYEPRRRLVARLMNDLGMFEQEVLIQINEERKALIAPFKS